MHFVPLLLQAAIPPDSTDVTRAIHGFTDFLLRYLIALAAVGALSMALLEAVKKIFDLRTRFQSSQWTAWMKRASFDRTALTAGPDDAASRAQAFAQLLHLCTALSRADAERAANDLITRDGISWSSWVSRDPAHALFALDLDKMLGSIQDAAEIALNAPARHPELYALMVTGADSTDVATWLAVAEPMATAGVAAAPPSDPAARLLVKERADVYARLRQVVKRKLDAFQLFTTDSWVRANQLSSVVLGATILFGALLYVNDQTTGQDTLTFAPMVLASIFGGILAPVAKDLVTALRRVKDG